MYDCSGKMPVIFYALTKLDILITATGVLDNLFVVITCFPACDIINFELTLAFLSSRLSPT